MMKKLLQKISITFLVALCGIVLPLQPFPVQEAHADVMTDLANGVFVGTAAQAAAAHSNQVVTTGCGLTSWDTGKCFNYILALSSATVLWIFSFLLTIAAWLLDYVLTFTVVNMSANIKNIGGITAGWTAIRDLANMFFIFILLYQAILTIIQGSSARRVIANIVIAALLINFSLFFTQVAIDASNIFTTGIYNSIAANGNQVVQGGTDTGFAKSFMAPLGVSSFYHAPDAALAISQSGLLAVIVSGMAGALIILITAVIFITVSFMFIARFVILVFLLVLSPLAVLGSVMPQVRTYSNQWLSTLTGQCLFAPVFMIMSWLTLRILTGTDLGIKLVNTDPTKSFAILASKDPTGAGPLLFNYAIIIAFLIASIIISKRFASQGGGMAASLMSRGSQWAGAAMFGTGAFIGRQTIGRGAEALSQNEALRNKAEQKGFGGYAARMALRRSNKTASRSFDVRSTKLPKDLTGGGKASGNGGFRKYKDKYVKDQESFAKNLSVSDKEGVFKAHKEKVDAEITHHKAQHAKALQTIRQSEGYKSLDTQHKNATEALGMIKTERETKERELKESKKVATNPIMAGTTAQREAEDKQRALEQEIGQLKQDESKHALTVEKVKNERIKLETTPETTKYLERIAELESGLQKEKKKDGKVIGYEPMTADDFAKKRTSERQNAYAEIAGSRSILNPLRYVYGKDPTALGVERIEARRKIRDLAKGDKKGKDKVFEDLQKALKEEEDEKSSDTKGEEGGESRDKKDDKKE
jgi:hypothetical protein